MFGLNRPKVRASLYALGVAVFAILGVYGIATQEQAAVWLGALGALLNVLAVVNVPRSDDDE
jgi:hypothetical protein